MADGEHLRIQHAVGELVEPLHDALEEARFALEHTYEGVIGSDRQEWLRVHIIRGLAFRHLNREADLGEWRLTGDHSQNGQVMLALKDGSITMRMLHSVSGLTPVAGSNHRRRAFYCNPELPMQVDLHGEMNHRLLMLWEEPLGVTDNFLLRVVRPLEPGRYGKNLRADLDVDLPRSESDFLKLRFEIADTELTFDATEEKGDGGS